MAMMAGRVLLVCALCVLWCGAAVVASSLPGATTVQSAWSEYMFLNWHELLKNECKAENATETNFDESAVKCCVHNAMRELCYDVYGKTVMENKDANVGVICKEYAGEPNHAGECPKQQQNPLPDAEATVGLSVPEVPGKERSLRAPAAAPPGASTAKPTDPPPSLPVEGQHDGADDMPGPNSEETSESMKTTKDLAEEDIVTTADTKQNEASNGQTEATTKTPPQASDDDDNETDKGTGEDTPNNAPESDVSETEENHDENKGNNSKETPVQVAGIKTVTAKPGDTDGSTAVSHTTSPLLLLLVVACAAAVVAA
ncbi:Mucin-associated surface protein (MASP) [Trypanosoma cruzi]|uniref:Mucin-associated surface protein (MASP), putative n=2 Tax=Trypanosoma cruzi TaxID=5693 RepID=Q4E5K6_TRYCC|nr:mucin-associated surface protein (MASP), putative [Trypanosoma cruzi]EAO00054.1 mucin-associated surface protein (MASP), putative [Trypanosoma cruzi]PWV06129.1 Mucin-associated surface protein (MASP) [Trypanosoma cruzi]|eukprot:XP_821905.1 mucin-associated surface protein (MASP) [Trypanosoma cruzi strain CL Brener]